MSERSDARSIVRRYEAARKANPKVPAGQLAAAMLPPVKRRDPNTGQVAYHQRTPTSAAAAMRVQKQIATGKLTGRRASGILARAQSGKNLDQGGSSGIQLALRDREGKVRSLQIRLAEGQSSLDIFTPEGKRKLKPIIDAQREAWARSHGPDHRKNLGKLEIAGARIIHLGKREPYRIAL